MPRRINHVICILCVCHKVKEEGGEVSMSKLMIQSEDDIDETTILSNAAYDNQDIAEPETPVYMEPYEAFVTCMQRYGRPNMSFLMERTGLSVGELAEGLDLYQDPVRYDLHREDDKDWYPFSYYVCNQHIPRLYKETKKMEEKYPGRFVRNLKVLEMHYPKLCGLTAYDLTLGIHIIPNWLYGEIFREILGVMIEPDVRHNQETERYSIRFRTDPSYVVSHVEYGTKNRGIKEILPSLMNGDEIEIRDPVNASSSSKPRYVRNEAETVALLAKVKLFVSEYYRVLSKRLADPEVYEQISERYCDSIGGYFKAQIHCDWVKVPGLEHVLRDYQKDGIGAVVMNPVTFFAWGTGAGKSLGMLASASELKRLRICHNILIIVPNNSLENFVAEINKYYPDGNYLVVYPKPFSQKKLHYLEKIKEHGEEYDAVVMAVSSYMMLDMSGAYYLAEIEKKIRTTKAALNSELSSRAYGDDAGILKRRLTVLKKKKKDLLQKKDKITDCFEELGFDALFCDECQEFKNVTLKCSYSHITGVTINGSPKCDKNMEKVHWILRGNDRSEGRVVFATATPQKNSISETYVWQKYLSETELAYAGMHSFQEWMKNFTETETKLGVSQDLQSMSLQTRLKYHNLTDLHGMMSTFMQYYHVDKSGWNIPAHGPYTNVIIPATETTIAIFEGIAERLKDWHDGLLTSKEYNPLAATLEGRAASSDPRLIEKSIIPAPGTTKSEICSHEVAKYYRLYPGTTQVVFCDLSVPKDSFNLYDEMKRHMVREGIPDHEIRFIHDADSPAKMNRLLTAFQEGSIRVLIGSTRKMGIGLNIQRKLKVVHHFDCPFSPSDLIQRNGRAIREGNENDEVILVRYIMERSYDAVSWDRVEMKQHWIESFNSPLMSEEQRNVGDLADNALSYGEAVAYAVGKPEMRRYVETDNELKRALIASRKRAKELQELREMVGTLPDKITKRERYITIIDADRKYYQKKKIPMTDGERKLFGISLLGLVRRSLDGEDVSKVLMNYQGFKIQVPVIKPDEEPYVKLCGVNGGVYRVKMETDKPLGCCQILNNYLGAQLEKIRDRHEKKNMSDRQNLAHAWDELKKGNPYLRRTEELQEKLALLEQELSI